MFDFFLFFIFNVLWNTIFGKTNRNFFQKYHPNMFLQLFFQTKYLGRTFRDFKKITKVSQIVALFRNQAFANFFSNKNSIMDEMEQNEVILYVWMCAVLSKISIFQTYKKCSFFAYVSQILKFWWFKTFGHLQPRDKPTKSEKLSQFFSETQ